MNFSPLVVDAQMCVKVKEQMGATGINKINILKFIYYGTFPNLFLKVCQAENYWGRCNTCPCKNPS